MHFFSEIASHTAKISHYILPESKKLKSDQNLLNTNKTASIIYLS